jgi:hypothetical protein
MLSIILPVTEEMDQKEEPYFLFYDKGNYSYCQFAKKYVF